MNRRLDIRTKKYLLKHSIHIVTASREYYVDHLHTFFVKISPLCISHIDINITGLHRKIINNRSLLITIIIVIDIDYLLLFIIDYFI